MFHVNPGDYFRMAILCDEIDKNRRTLGIDHPWPGQGDRRRGAGDWLRPHRRQVPKSVSMRGPGGVLTVQSGQSEARVALALTNQKRECWVVFQILFVYFHTREPDSQGTEKTSPIINIRLSPKYFCDSQILFFPD